MSELSSKGYKKKLTGWKINIPPEFDEKIYKDLHPDLKKHDHEALYQHYLNYGKREGRCANGLKTRMDFVLLIPLMSKLLEIGPFCHPLTQQHRNVKYFDIMATSALIKRAREIGLSEKDIPSSIDFISSTADLSIISEKFEFILSSHVIEHQLDFLGHLKNVYSLLLPGGYYFILIPDKRYCFDHYIPESNLAAVMEAHYYKRKAHPLSSLLEHRALTTHNIAADHWRGIHGRPFENLKTRLQLAIKEYQSSSGNYIDLHRWYFTPDSFTHIILGLRQLEPEFFNIVALYPTRYGANEFWVILEK